MKPNRDGRAHRGNGNGNIDVTLPKVPTPGVGDRLLTADAVSELEQTFPQYASIHPSDAEINPQRNQLVGNLRGLIKAIQEIVPCGEISKSSLGKRVETINFGHMGMVDALRIRYFS